MSKEENSKEENSEQEIAKKPLYMTVFKILFFVSAFFIIIFTVLANVNGNKKIFKDGIEGYLSSATGYHASVGTLNYAAFFPNIIFDFEDMDLRQKEGDITPVASVKKIQIKLCFFDVMFGNGKFKSLNIEGVSTVPGVFLSKAVKLDSLSVEEKKGSAILKAVGYIGNDSFMAKTDIDVFGKGKWRAYGFSGHRHLEAHLGGIKVFTDLNNGEFSNLKITLNDQDVITGSLTLEEIKGKINAKAKLLLSGSGTILEPDILISKSSIKGTIISPSFHVEDIGGESLVVKMIEEVSRILGDGDQEEKVIDLVFEDVDLTMKIEEFHVAKGNLGSLKFPVKIKDKELKIKLGGKLSKGDLKGHIVLDVKKLPAALDVDISLRNLDYGSLQQSMNDTAEIYGVGNVVLKVKSQGDTVQALMKGLNGQATFIGGEGRFKSGVINLWGGGLVNAILPDISTEEELGVNCAIVDFKIEDSLATSNTMFLDGKHVTLAGTGTYDIVEDNLDISIKPKSKDIAIGSLATAINITGSIGNPSISPSLFSFGAKIGGLLLGIVNPAFLAFTLTDIGLSDEHPCAAFIGVAENLPKENKVSKLQEEKEVEKEVEKEAEKEAEKELLPVK